MSFSSQVWVVDDDEDDRFILKMVFKQVAPLVTLKALTDGDELVPSLETAHVLPKLVLLDLNMDRMDGFDTLRQVKAVPTYQPIPIVILTTSSAEEDRAKALRLGANDFLTKPASMGSLALVVDRLIKQWGISAAENKSER